MADEKKDFDNDLQAKLAADNAAVEGLKQTFAESQGAHTDDAPQNDPKTEVKIEGSLEEFEAKREERRQQALRDLQQLREENEELAAKADKPQGDSDVKADQEKQDDLAVAAKRENSNVRKGRE